MNKRISDIASFLMLILVSGSLFTIFIWEDSEPSGEESFQAPISRTKNTEIYALMAGAVFLALLTNYVRKIKYGSSSGSKLERDFIRDLKKKKAKRDAEKAKKEEDR